MLSLISKMLRNGQVDRGGSLVGTIRGSTQRVPLVVGLLSKRIMCPVLRVKRHSKAKRHDFD
ncbi:hypothetical protein ACE6H2_028496 [Prunus campanulata]